MGQFALQLQPGRKGGTIPLLGSLETRVNAVAKLDRLADGITWDHTFYRGFLCRGGQGLLQDKYLMALVIHIIALGLETLPPQHVSCDLLL